MTVRRRAGGRAPFVDRAWMWAAAALLWAVVGYLSLAREVPTPGVGLCLAGSIACTFRAGQLAGEDWR